MMHLARALRPHSRRRFHGLVQLSEASTSKRPPAVYVQGFLTTQKTFAPWVASNDRLECSTDLSWGPAYGFEWHSGADGDALGRFPLPLALSTRMAWWVARRTLVTPASVATAALGDAVASAVRMHRHYRHAEARLSSEAAYLADSLTALRKDAGPYRLIGHSLGGPLVLRALGQMAPVDRPCHPITCSTLEHPVMQHQ